MGRGGFGLLCEGDDGWEGRGGGVREGEEKKVIKRDGK